MATRMKLIMNSIIEDNQSAYVGGRKIYDNLIIVHEAFHSKKKNAWPSKWIRQKLTIGSNGSSMKEFFGLTVSMSIGFL